MPHDHHTPPAITILAEDWEDSVAEAEAEEAAELARLMRDLRALEDDAE